MTLSQYVIVRSARQHALLILAGEFPPKDIRSRELACAVMLFTRTLQLAQEYPDPAVDLLPLRGALERLTGEIQPLARPARGAR